MRNNTITYPRRFFGGLFVVFLGALVLLIVSVTSGPDRELHFQREIPSDLSPDRLALNLSATTRWPQWFHSMAKAQIIEPLASSQKPLEVQEGTVVLFNMDPAKGMRKKFDLTAKVTAFQPAQMIQFDIVNDSSGRLTQVFDRLQWKVEILAKPNGGSLIRGTATAHTCHWRSRLFGTIAERIVMNQVFYPNLIKLSELKQPFSADPENSQYSPWK